MLDTVQEGPYRTKVWSGTVHVVILLNSLSEGFSRQLANNTVMKVVLEVLTDDVSNTLAPCLIMQ